MICHKQKIIFVHSAKCGGESVEQVVFGRSDTGYNGDPYRGSPQKHWGCSDYIAHHGEKIFNEYFVFGFIRNPWDRAISRIMYRNKRFNRPMEIPLQLLKKECRINRPLYDDFFVNKTCAADFIGRLENFQHDFNFACDKIGIPQKKLPHKNKSEHKHYTEYYDDETKELVAKKYAKDIECFGYKFGE